MTKELLEYYAGDELAASTWQGKYALKISNTTIEKTPEDMHRRMAREFARVEGVHTWNKEKLNLLSQKGQDIYNMLGTMVTSHLLEEWVMGYISGYKYIIPQGSIMSMLGNPHAVGSLSNCFVIPPPLDSYGGIFKTDEQIAQLEKRRGGVGTNLNTLRPDSVPVSNAAGSSTGSHSFMSRFSNTTREVAQNGRRGALMLLLSVLHPDIFKFVTKKADLTQVTGANISAMLTDNFMMAVMDDTDFICRFPVNADIKLSKDEISLLPYNKLTSLVLGVNGEGVKVEVMRIRARELYDTIVEMAWSNGEPGVAFIDRVKEYCPEGVYPRFVPVASNPCGEQWMNPYDACRLLALNLFSVVKNAWTGKAEIDYELLYEIAYVQQRLADDIVDLEVEYIERIITKVIADPEPLHVKTTELELWQNIKRTALASRRTGCGFTGLADMLAALGLKYDSDEALEKIHKVMKTKMRAELDCTTDLAIMRGTFEGWDREAEWGRYGERITGRNEFFEMLLEEFPEQAQRFYTYGRRNVSWSTVAPTGTVSIVAKLNKYPGLSAGVEPQFAVYFYRNKKGNPGDKGFRSDFVDQNGDHWMTYPVMQGGFKEWIEATRDAASFVGVDNLPKEVVEELFKQSPYYGACANDIDWKRRIEIQAVVQRYTTNAISSTLNLPNNVSKQTVNDIYLEAWKHGLKGVTVYRDGCRTGVLVTEAKAEKKEFEYRDATKRPKELPADLHVVTVKGKKYGVVIGLMEGKPYEVFAFNLPEDVKKACSGSIVKQRKGHYNFVCEDGKIQDLQEAAVHSDEQVLTRLVSGMLRHGAKPQFVMDQIDKCDLEVVSFGKAVSRTLKKYIPEEELLSGARCKDCNSTNLRLQEGCITCMDCGSSKCG